MSNEDPPRPTPGQQLASANAAANGLPVSQAGGVCQTCPPTFRLEYKSRYTERGQQDRTANRYTEEVWVARDRYIFLIGQERRLTVRTNPPIADVEWEVTPIGTHSGTVRQNRGRGPEFAFVPSVTAAQRPTSASRTANPPVEYQVTARSASAGTVTERITQDPRDIIRQEYVDARMYRRGFTLHVPYRDRIIEAPRPEFLINNNYARYRLVLDSGMMELLAAVEAEFGAEVTVNSSWRSPRRNLAAGSTIPNSNHQHGGAIDMAPSGYNAIRGRQAGRTAILALYRAAMRAQVTTGARMVLLEKGPKQIHPGSQDLPRPDAQHPDRNDDGIIDGDTTTTNKLTIASHVHIDRTPPDGGEDD